jgi:cytochrome c oxidase assembly factor CtaG
VTPAPWTPTFEPIFLGAAALAVAFYVRSARKRRPPRWRIVLFGLGIALIAVPLNSPLETISDHYLVLIHLLQNAMIADWAPPLVLLGLTPAMREAVRRRGGAPLAAVSRPALALALWLAAWYGTHYPTFYDGALRHGWPLNLEHAILIVAGFLFWWPLLEPQPRRLSTEGTLGYLAIAFITSPWLSLALIFSTRPLYSFYVHAPRLWHLSPSEDQNLGGVLMNAELTAIFFVVLAYQLLRLLAEEERRQSELDALHLSRTPPRPPNPGKEQPG